MGMSKDRFVHYITGVAEMDKQHWELFVSMDAIVVQLKARDYLHIAGKVAELSTLMVIHFKLEDTLMVETDYPFITEHRKAHASQMNHLRDVALRAQSNPLFSDTYISDTSELLVKHVDEHDMQLATHLTKFNLTSESKDAIITP